MDGSARRVGNGSLGVGVAGAVTGGRVGGGAESAVRCGRVRHRRVLATWNRYTEDYDRMLEGSASDEE